MKFPIRLSALLCAIICPLLMPAVARAEPQKSAGLVPIVAEIIYAPTDLAKLRARAGRRVVLEGKIVAMGKSKSGSTTYLNFTKNYHESVSLVILGGAGAKEFPKDKLAEYVGKKIHIGGILEERSGALQMRVFDVEQIKVVP